MITPHVQAKVPYEVARDFTGVSLLTRAPMVVAVSASFPAQTFAELVARAKAEPGKVTYASVGVGGQGHLVTELLAKRLGLALLHVPYKGSAPALTDLAGGQVSMMMTTPLDLVAQRGAGLIRVIATGALQRSPFLPDVPTIAESGFADIDLGYWFSAIVVRAGTPLRKRMAEQQAAAASTRRRAGLRAHAQTHQAHSQRHSIRDANSSGSRMRVYARAPWHLSGDYPLYTPVTRIRPQGLATSRRKID